MKDPTHLRQEIRAWLGLKPVELHVGFVVDDVKNESTYERRRIVYNTQDGDPIGAFMLVPVGLRQPAPAVLVHHQHNGQWHFGKSEVCGLVGDPLQAFGSALAERGVIVLAPDSICFEDRRTGTTGTEPHPDDWLQHFNEMSYRLLRGDTLMRKVLQDAAVAVSLLSGLDMVDPSRLGTLGHSYGGNTVLFQAALDGRVRYACTSGAVCSYRNKMLHATGIEMAEILPGVLGRFEVEDLLSMAAPRPMLVVSASEDKYSRDAGEMVQLASAAYATVGAADALQHVRYEGGHALTRERFDRIVQWVATAAHAVASG